MYTAMFFVYGLLQLVLLVWLVREWRRTGAAAAAVLLLPQFFLIWDNWVVASGAFLGFGDFLKALSWPRFWAHWFCGGWLVIASGAILRLAGFEWAKKASVMGAFCIIATCGMVYDLPYFWTQSLMPVCEYDLIRYSTQVAAANVCSPDQPVVAGSFPLVPIITCFVVIGAGAVLAVKRRFPWMMLGGILMFISATPPVSRYKLDQLGEVLISGGAIWAIWHFTRNRSDAVSSPQPTRAVST
jgi:hypothetical protein